MFGSTFSKANKCWRKVLEFIVAIAKVDLSSPEDGRLTPAIDAYWEYLDKPPMFDVLSSWITCSVDDEVYLLSIDNE